MRYWTTLISVAALGGASTAASLAAQSTSTTDPAFLVDQAFQKAREVSSENRIERLDCDHQQLQIVISDGQRLSYPCNLQTLVEDQFDATMLVTLLLAEPAAAQPTFERERDPAEKVVAIGVAAVASGLDPDSDIKTIERNLQDEPGRSSPPLAIYAPPSSDAFRREAARAEREENRSDQSADIDERRRERARQERAEEAASEARYESITRFLELANAQQFCPADGRAFLQRATEFATSPRQSVRPLGLWADDRRHDLEPYLNDVGRCR